MKTIPLTLPGDAPISRSLLDCSPQELTDVVNALPAGQKRANGKAAKVPAYRIRQIQEWIYKKYARSFDEMTNLPQALRDGLAATATLTPLEPVTQRVSKAGDTLKVLFQMPDGETVEAVLMLYNRRRTLCISSQAGCAMGCTFCATALGGLRRNLTAGEIVAQVLFFARYLSDAGEGPTMRVQRPTTVTNIVLMGMGEPMHNYKNVWTAIRRLTAADGFALGARHITLSTVGLIPMIDRMADEGLQVNLAVSLHAPNNDLRSKLVPPSRRYPVDDLLASVRRYIAKTNRRVTFEYALMRGTNDSPALAEDLADKLQGILCHVNLIPLNPIPDSPFQPTSDKDTQRFANILLARGISTTVRIRRGIEIDAGCGQLRNAAAS
ncbi:MAG: 23S rRNA (adenine(2503)-C(2))-methyltransferase RlmN [Caldilineaceae bacterium SB0675_bin_29]|uniref:Probable dual-specificity RNA methyltransferase RlmN n=1 Tax=Caldilineaceae bacterium SB0675_bin_29 TaxID=2605266 RepID=A0A6B1FWI6_9CHLR|nr:23S rRNA (adenine(2503)-C(2))-methyltransferase RlmN [Caldilineaceae bacterium SB0675_bin_29]